MTDAPMKPQEQIIYMLGEIRGQMTALQSAVENNATAQAAINAANQAEHASFRTKLAEHDAKFAVIDSQRKPPSPWWSIASGIAAIVAVVVTLTAFLAPLVHAQ